ERRCGRGAEEGHVNDPLGTSGNRRVDEGDVLLNPVRRLCGRDHEDGMRTAERRLNARAVTVLGRGDVTAGQVWRPGRIAHQQALLHTELGQSTGHPPAEPTGRASYCDGCL